MRQNYPSISPVTIPQFGDILPGDRLEGANYGKTFAAYPKEGKRLEYYKKSAFVSYIT